MKEELLEEQKNLKFALEDLLQEDTHIGVYYKGYVDDYFHKSTTNIIKLYLLKDKEEIIEKLRKRIEEIDESLKEL